jgi:hypothetical protein
MLLSLAWPLLMLELVPEMATLVPEMVMLVPELALARMPARLAHLVSFFSLCRRCIFAYLLDSCHRNGYCWCC